MTEMERSWADLTYEALVEVMKRVDFEQLYVGLPLVCKAWRVASLDPGCWERVHMEPSFRIRSETDAWWQPAFEAKVDYMLKLAVDRSAGSLLELSTRHCSNSALSYLASRCPSARLVSVSSSRGVTDLSICQLAKSCPQLEHLDVSECQNVTVTSLEQVGQNCKSLTVLKRNRFIGNYNPSRKSQLPSEYSRTSSPANADAEAQVICTLMTNLKHLELRHTKLSDQGLFSLLDGCTNLECLDITGCLNLTRRAKEEARARLPNEKLRDDKTPAQRNVNVDRYGHWQLYNERFQSGFFQF
ncbi:hypothetical protein GOP47_0003499 [Adiantum capillus-veneris]|uniref:F-box domain-containing protein n=1 Tax=Adiantum capillus-veneris TaxID=13818 RepID=A0A9D4ZRX1_ADICA|nr:hypothetical protein GOP47_0003499 [Adiantum capillus-veneris]